MARLNRAGWVKRGVQNPETVQEHTEALINLASALSNNLPEFSELEKQEMVSMLEIHDWPESIVGDQIIVNPDPIEKEKLKATKYQQEYEAMQQICSNLGDTGSEIFNLWLRFENSSDKVAVLARQIDMYQAIEKALEYEKLGYPVSTQDFISYAEPTIIHPVLIQRLTDLKKQLLTLKQ
ncbi:MAG TPA: HD domain-containing protein [Coxiellaceae bacterium]|nr:HD domain-containing protein [Coxiellaceae bacterium]